MIATPQSQARGMRLRSFNPGDRLRFIRSRSNWSDPRLFLRRAGDPLEGDLYVIVGVEEAAGEFRGRGINPEGSQLERSGAAGLQFDFVQALHSDGHLDGVGFA